MFRLLILVIIQSLFLSGGQLLLKHAIDVLPRFSWDMSYFKAILTNWWFFACGGSFAIATLMWLYMLKHFLFTQVYPLTAISYIFGVFAATIVIGESVPFTRWIGVVFMVIGCFLITK